MKLITTTTYKCDCCGKEFEYIPGAKDKDYCFWMVPFGKGYAGWEHDFSLCSTECYYKLSKVDRSVLKKLVYNKITYREYERSTRTPDA